MPLGFSCWSQINPPHFSVNICWLLWVSPVLSPPATPLPLLSPTEMMMIIYIVCDCWRFSPPGCIWGFLGLNCHSIWYLSCLVFSEFLDLWFGICHEFEEIPSHYCFKYFCVPPPPSLFSFWYYHYRYVTYFIPVPENWIPVSFSFFFSLCTAEVSTDVSSKKSS